MTHRRPSGSAQAAVDPAIGAAGRLLRNNKKVRLSLILAAILSLVAVSLSPAAEAQHDYTFTDIDGVEHGSLADMDNRATVLYFVMTDCPISNRFAPEIDRTCTEYEAKGVGCFLVYVDHAVTNEAIREHTKDYNHDCCPAINDAKQVLVEKAGATITPEAVVMSPAREILYRGRINDFYTTLGRSRREARVHDLRDALDEVLAGKPVTNPRTEAVGCYIPPKNL